MTAAAKPKRGLQLVPRAAKPWQSAVADAAAKFKHGDVIPKEWLVSALDVHVPEQGTPREYEKAKMMLFARTSHFVAALLTQHRMMLETNHRGGYLVVMPGDQSRLALERARRDVCRAVDLAKVRVEYTDVAALSADEARERSDAQAKLAAFGQLVPRRLGP